ncbi:hypothetical protein PENSTE_c002G03834 [Penicillium steckii]|uniref:Protein kinase domain-containing protein n=1 Tax=Penicillium steckii TaxID=303698 RepID=A0A1V6TSW2_9EURO|nr:hypothetical protein PENSTE_c002G03834 [Penicillium steckii]
MALLAYKQGHTPECKGKPSVEDPIFGSNHVIFPINFNNGVRWAAKIHIDGTRGKWTTSSCEAFESEAATMVVLTNKTTIPMPKVFTWSSGHLTRVGCPFILMSFIEGVSLYDLWFGNHLGTAPTETTTARRKRALDGIGGAMVQLGQFTSAKSGCYLNNRADPTNKLGETRPTRQFDQQAMHYRRGCLNDPDFSPIWYKVPSSNYAQVYYTPFMDLQSEKNDSVTKYGAYNKGLDMLTCKLISWIPEPGRQDPFVLPHASLAMKDFIVSKDGELQGIVGWNGVAAVPMSIGNERYPTWLTRDCHPTEYDSLHRMGRCGGSGSGRWEETRKEIPLYRDYYQDAIQRVQTKPTDPNIDLCQLSLLTEMLHVASTDPDHRSSTLWKIVREMFHELLIASRMTTLLFFS